jgi:predicted RNA-binding protein (virulence factor B family)
MTFQPYLGRTAKLVVRRLAPPGAFLELSPQVEETLLLPRAEVPEDAQPGDELTVFVYLDSSDRPIATTRAPRLELGEVSFLEVTDLTRFGAFVDWGLPKELLVPFAEQTEQLQLGDLHPVGLLLDASGRLSGTMRIRELLSEGGNFEIGEWVEGEAWRKEPGLGVFVIVERRFVGLLPEQETNLLRRGQAASFRVANVWPDGKIELSLRGLGHEELEHDARAIFERLCERDAPRISDKADPERIRNMFGLSKKAFKRAVGRLLKEGAVRINRDGQLEVVAASSAHD